MLHNNLNTLKEPPPGQPRLEFPVAQPSRAVPATSTNGNDEHRSLIAKAVSMSFMLSGKDYTITLSNKSIQTSSQHQGWKAKSQHWGKIGLIGKILQECSYKDRMQKFRDKIIAKIEEKFDDEMYRLEDRVKAMRKEVEDMSNVSTKLKDKVEELVKEAEARGTTSWARLVELEAGEVAGTDTAQLLYANAAQAKSEADSDWKLTEKVIVVKANLALEKMLQDKGKGREMKVIVATKLQGNGAFLLMRSEAEAEAMKIGEHMTHFCDAWRLKAFLRPNYHKLVVKSLLI
ncbi:uncharacterized protein C8R40DRAFT_1065027 [Lentinula edodes]|uniref:uncharacterized protein n=1 Tax=Lentinula edodes TaxID=5353 RepID=UPI001E8D11B9|nr:uncharacterized protein C8R40DRAFT_1065027 [Lentinula edodes]KAH7881335.1 hypothetical protein C8R40DRAFT_1065027 [Lentinula edodes]